MHDAYEDLHILGYDLDHTDSTLLDALEDFRADRVRRIFAMADRLRELGFALDDTAIRAHAAPGRPHIADAILATPPTPTGSPRRGSTARTRSSPPTSSPARPATCAASARRSRDAIDVIHAAGGLAVWAHPFWDVTDPGDTLSSSPRTGSTASRRSTSPSPRSRRSRSTTPPRASSAY